MYQIIKFNCKSNLICSDFKKLQKDNILCRNMSQKIITSNQDKYINEQSNKRQCIDTDYEIIAKAPKVEAIDTVVQKESDVSNKAMKARKKFVMMLGYLGRNYFGMQINRGTKTIEESLLTALLKANFITKDQFEDMREIRFQRAARTDKGVSAVRQIVSLLLPNNVNKEDVNEHLPQDIRVFDIKRVTKSFNSKTKCDARTYRYVLPTFTLAPEDLAFLQVDEDEEIDEKKRLEQLSMIDEKPYNEFRLTPEMLNKLNEILKLFEGTHNFHNFTSKVKPMDPRAKRYIIYFRCIETFISNNMEFAVLEVKGQSFMLHQIRKMVSLVIGICRNIVSSSIIKDTFSLEKIDIPLSPGFGLSLHFVHYGYYNKRFGKDGFHETLDWKECNDEVEKFYKDHILQEIVDTEISNKVMLQWLASFLTPKRFTNKDVV